MMHRLPFLRALPRFFLAFLGSALAGPAVAQQTAYQGLIRENWLFINPAALDLVAIENKLYATTFLASHRQQWLGLEGAPIQSVLRMEHLGLRPPSAGQKRNDPVLKWGIAATYDRVGAWNSVQLTGNFGYFLKLNPRVFCILGVNITPAWQSLRIRPDDFLNFAADPAALSLADAPPTWRLSSDAGAFVYVERRNGVLFGGVSAQQLFQVAPQGIARKPHLHLLGGWFHKGDGLWFSPALNIRYVPGVAYQVFQGRGGASPFSADLNVRVFLPDGQTPKGWAGLGVSSAGTLAVELGYRLTKDPQKMNSAPPYTSIGLQAQTPSPGLGPSFEFFLAHQLND